MTGSAHTTIVGFVMAEPRLLQGPKKGSVIVGQRLISGQKARY